MAVKRKNTARSNTKDLNPAQLKVKIEPISPPTAITQEPDPSQPPLKSESSIESPSAKENISQSTLKDNTVTVITLIASVWYVVCIGIIL